MRSFTAYPDAIIESFTPTQAWDDTDKCNIEYSFHKNGTFAEYRHYVKQIKQLPKNVTYVGDDKNQWCSVEPAEYWKTKEVLQMLYCVCEGDLCNGLGSPIHYQLLKMVKDITGSDFPEKFSGFVPTKPVAPKYCYAGVYPTSTPYKQVTVDEKAGCNIEYMFEESGRVISCDHGISQADPPADPKSIVYVGEDKSQWCSHDYTGFYRHKIFCQCQGSLCNGVLSPIHQLLVKMAKDITGSASLDFSSVAVTTTTKAEGITECEDEENGETTTSSVGIKPIMIIYSFVMMIYNIILV